MFILIVVKLIYLSHILTILNKSCPSNIISLISLDNTGYLGVAQASSTWSALVTLPFKPVVGLGGGESSRHHTLLFFDWLISVISLQRVFPPWVPQQLVNMLFLSCSICVLRSICFLFYWRSNDQKLAKWAWSMNIWHIINYVLDWTPTSDIIAHAQSIFTDHVKKNYTKYTITITTNNNKWCLRIKQKLKWK